MRIKQKALVLCDLFVRDTDYGLFSIPQGDEVTYEGLDWISNDLKGHYFHWYDLTFSLSDQEIKNVLRILVPSYHHIWQAVIGG